MVEDTRGTRGDRWSSFLPDESHFQRHDAYASRVQSKRRATMHCWIGAAWNRPRKRQLREEIRTPAENSPHYPVDASFQRRPYGSLTRGTSLALACSRFIWLTGTQSAPPSDGAIWVAWSFAVLASIFAAHPRNNSRGCGKSLANRPPQRIVFRQHCTNSWHSNCHQVVLGAHDRGGLTQGFSATSRSDSSAPPPVPCSRHAAAIAGPRSPQKRVRSLGHGR
jgi:hypothetical protein